MSIHSLLLKVYSVILLVLSLLTSPLSFAQQSIDESMSADPNSNVRIEHLSGTAKIVGWNKDEVKIKGELSELTEELIFERDGKSIKIIVKVERKSKWGNWNDNKGDNIVINVPQNSRVDYTTTNTDVSISNILGGLKAEVVNGDMDVDNAKGRVRLESVNGDISAMDITGELNIETVNGDIRTNQTDHAELELSTVNGDIQATSQSKDVISETVNGDIELSLKNIDDLELSTVNGSIEVEMVLNANGEVRASSVGGSIELMFQEDIAANFDIEAHAGGSIKNRISNDEVSKAKYGPRRWLKFSTPNASANVDVSTVHGRVKLEKN